MSSTLILVVTTIIILFLLLPLLFLFRRRVDLSLEGDVLVLKYPLTDKKIDLQKELESWEVQRAFYIRWGVFYSINMRFKNRKSIVVSSLFNQNNYSLLFSYLNERFKGKRKGDGTAVNTGIK
jgi:hypothetical protein